MQTWALCRIKICEPIKVMMVTVEELCHLCTHPDAVSLEEGLETMLGVVLCRDWCNLSAL